MENQKHMIGFPQNEEKEKAKMGNELVDDDYTIIFVVLIWTIFV